MIDIPVRHYMTPNPMTVPRATRLADALRLMKEHHIRHLPVIDGTVLAGVLEQPDAALVAVMKGLLPDALPVGSVMKAKPHVIPPSADIEDVAQHMIETKESCAIVVDGGRVVGVFTLIDALRALVDLAA